jgi:hypothetical protein
MTGNEGISVFLAWKLMKLRIFLVLTDGLNAFNRGLNHGESTGLTTGSDLC